MKIIKVDDELYQFIAGKTERIGEDASDILRRLLGVEPLHVPEPEEKAVAVDELELNELEEQPTVVGRFLYILNALHKAYQERFECVLGIKGRDRLYFAKSKEELMESGSSTNPKEIGETGYWVLTNSNTHRKKWMLAEVANQLGYDETDVLILTDKL